MCWEHHACYCSVLHTDWVLVNDTHYHSHKLNPQSWLGSAWGGAISWGTGTCKPPTGRYIPCRWCAWCWVCFQGHHRMSPLQSFPWDTSFLRIPLMSWPEFFHQGAFKTSQRATVSIRSTAKPLPLSLVYVIWMNVLLLNNTFSFANGETALRNTKNDGKLSNGTALLDHMDIFLPQRCLDFFRSWL